MGCGAKAPIPGELGFGFGRRLRLPAPSPLVALAYRSGWVRRAAVPSGPLAISGLVGLAVRVVASHAGKQLDRNRLHLPGQDA